MDSNKLNMNKNYLELLRIFDEAFNGKIDFSAMDSKEFFKFVNEFMEGKTEYYKDDYFLKNYNPIVLELIK